MRTLIPSSALVAVILSALPSSAVAQAPREEQAAQNRFCMIIGNEGRARCAYRTLAQCERSARGSGGRCFDRTYMLAAAPPAEPAPPPRRRVPRHVPSGY